MVVSSNSMSLVEISSSTTSGGGPMDEVSKGDLLNFVTDCCIDYIRTLLPLSPPYLPPYRGAQYTKRSIQNLQESRAR